MILQNNATYYYKRFLRKITSTWGALAGIMIIFSVGFKVGKTYQEIKSDKEINLLLIEHFQKEKSSSMEIMDLRLEKENSKKELIELKVKISEYERK